MTVRQRAIIRGACRVAPGVWSTAALLMLVTRHPHHDRVDALAVACTLVGVVWLISWQVLDRRENRRLTRSLEARMDDLVRASERTRALLDGLVEAVVVIDRDGRVVDVNEPFLTLTGRTAASMARIDGLSVVAPEDRPRVLAAIDGLRTRHGAADTIEMRIVRADGSIVWVDGSARNLLAEPSVAALVITMRDISERHAAAQALLDAQAMFRSAFDGAPIGMVLAAPDGRMLEVNAAFARMLGFVPAELEGRDLCTLVLAEGAPSCPGDVADRLAAPGTWVLDTELLDAAGRRVATSITGRRLDAGPSDQLVICQILDVSAVRHATDQLVWSAAHDALTGLPNRAEFGRALGTALERCPATASVGVVYVDLDRFKLVNDSLGHAAGDELLQVVARRLAAVVRTGDVVARLGSDEFTVLVTAHDVDAVVAVADRIRQAVAEPVMLADGDVYVTASVGVAVGSPAMDGDDLVRDADAALHRAKERGRDRVERFDADTRSRVVATLRTATDLHRALERGELVVHYQPVVDLTDLRIRAVEALVRWNHGERGMVSPAEFIPMAEDTGLIVPVGERVLDLAAGDLARWQALPGWSDLRVNVNLSPRQMAAPNVVEMFERAIARHGVDPDGLWVEITETALMADVRMATVILRAMRQMGLHVAVDDFGTGYSSLTYLTRFPVECLKIDRSFVAGLGTDHGADAIVDAVVGLGRTMGLSVVSEGIETEAQAVRLRSMGCPLGQGYLYSRPVPAERIDELLVAGLPLSAALAS